jgi:hypothetical protein
MKAPTLFVTVGRAAPMPLATGDAAQLDAAKAAKLADLMRAGVSLDRVTFSTDAPVAAASAPVAKRKGR